MIAFQKRLSKNLQKILKEKEISMRGLAIRAGIAQKTVWNYYYGYTDSPDIEVVRKLAKALDMSIGELLKEEDEYECKY